MAALMTCMGIAMHGGCYAWGLLCMGVAMHGGCYACLHHIQRFKMHMEQEVIHSLTADTNKPYNLSSSTQTS